MSDDKGQKPITILVSPRCLFNMEEERKIFDVTGSESYIKYQQDHENEPLMKGPAFQFVKALENVNKRLQELDPDSGEIFNIVLMTNNCVQVGVRLMNSLRHYGLLIDRLCMTGGNSSIGQLEVYQPNLYLSADPKKVREAIRAGIGSATMFQTQNDQDLSDVQLKVAFDGDGVLFSNESEKIFQRGGLAAFLQNEEQNKNNPLAEGPLKVFFETLVKLQKKFYAKGMDCPIRTYLVTSRGTGSDGKRVLKTFTHWGLKTDEAFFLAGQAKGPCLEYIRPHIFFDDQEIYITEALKLGTIAAHVPWTTE